MLMQLDFLVVADRAYLLSVGVNLLGLKSIDSVSRTQFPNLPTGQPASGTCNQSAVQVNLDGFMPVPPFLQGFFLYFGHVASFCERLFNLHFVCRSNQ
jgi:hypothetical protein